MKLENVALLFKDQEARIGGAAWGPCHSCVRLDMAACTGVGSLKVPAESMEAHKC